MWTSKVSGRLWGGPPGPRGSPWTRLPISARGFSSSRSRPRTKASTPRSRGSALLAVLWVSAALSAIGLSLAATVRSETDRTATSLDGLRAYYLASAGVQRAMYEIQWSIEDPGKRALPEYTTQVDYRFPSGDVHVQILPEAGKLSVNNATPEQLYRLCVALGIAPDRAREITLAIVDWRTPAKEGPLDGYYLSLSPSFRARHASLEEIEELLQVKGITPDIFYGTYAAVEGEGGPAGRHVEARPGLIDCLSVFGAGGPVDANTAPPAVLQAVGLPPDTVNALVQQRRSLPFNPERLQAFLSGMGIPSTGQLTLQGRSIVTIRATARLRQPDGKLSDLRRTVGAQVKYMPRAFTPSVHVLRWYDTVWSN